MDGDIESVIGDAIADAGDVGIDDAATGGDVAVVDAGDGAVADPVEGAADPAAATAVVEDAFAKEHGLITRRPDGRENRIPYSRVKAIAESRERKTIAAVAKALGITKAEAELKMDDVTGALTERSTKMTGYEERLASIDAIEKIMADEPERFMAMMSQANPAYARFVAQQEAAAAVDDDPEPKADFDLGDGKMTYSLDGLQKLREWDRRQVAKLAKAELDKELKPFKDQRQAEAEQEKARTIRANASERVTAQLEKAKLWPGFVENSEAIREAFNADPTMTLQDAYMKVRLPQMAAERTTIRQEVLAELKKAPAATSTTATKGAVKDDSGSSIDDIVRQSIASLKR